MSEERKRPQDDRLLPHAPRHSGKRWHVLQTMRELERQGMHFKPVGSHLFYGYWEEQPDPRTAGASVINKYG